MKLSIRRIFGLTLSTTLLGGLIFMTATSMQVPLLNMAGLVTVIGGTLAATIISRSWRELKATFKSIPVTFRAVAGGQVGDLDRLLNIAEWMRRGRTRAADQACNEIADPFLHTGIRLVLDRTPAEDIESVLQWRIATTRRVESTPIETLKAMANYAPSFGMLGTLLGLMTLLYGIDTLSARGIGHTLGYALLSTVYGIVLANLLLRPIATKMEKRLAAKLNHMHMMQEAIHLLEKRRHPVIIAESIAAFGPENTTNKASAANTDSLTAQAA